MNDYPTWREATHQTKPPARALAARLHDIADALDEGEAVSGSEVRALANDAVRIADRAENSHTQAEDV